MTSGVFRLDPELSTDDREVAMRSNEGRWSEDDRGRGAQVGTTDRGLEPGQIPDARSGERLEKVRPKRDPAWITSPGRSLPRA